MKYGCVVIADSHQNMLEGIRGLLEDVFGAVVMVADMKSLFDATEKLKPELIILDLSISAKDGSNAVAKFTSAFPGARLVVMSVHDDPSTVDKIIQSGASAFVLKRSAATDLIPAIEEVLGGHTHISLK